MTRALTVWWDGAVVGALTADRHGAMRFAYDDGWLADPAAPAISVSLPRRPEPFPPRATRPFFEGLLPEGAERDGAARALGISPANEFALLERLGGDVAGALTIWPHDAALPPAAGGAAPGAAAGDNAAPGRAVGAAADDSPTPGGVASAGASAAAAAGDSAAPGGAAGADAGDSATTGRAAATGLSDAALAALLERIAARPFLAGEPGLRLSLAGAQSKLPVVLVDDRIALPAPGQPTTHILKPPAARFQGITENEAFAMRLAGRLGLEAASVAPIAAAGRPCLLIERYDRQPRPDGPVRRLHQEDFCQALGLVSARKYAADGGPGFRHCFELVRRACARPAVDVLKLLDAAIVHVLIGNADAHGKNYSLLHRDDGIALAPLYDLISTVAWPALAPGFAMRVAGRTTLDELRAGDWDHFAATAGLGAPFVRRRVAELADRARAAAHDAADALADTALDPDAVAACAARVAARARQLAATV